MGATYNMHEAKTHLSRLAERAANGEEIVIARNGRAVARLVAMPERKKRRLGLAKGEIWISDDFDAPLPPDIQEAFEGKRD
ncbi:MAG TPA: type II toxin-antitoxin system Phd/YefM family antitoxin [Solirubrobacteraceae bacterium]|nr:type II toxin-antitoxin system Phd/YefM family antitoxin [Solirubrobacteraceae bacterium]